MKRTFTSIVIVSVSMAMFAFSCNDDNPQPQTQSQTKTSTGSKENTKTDFFNANINGIDWSASVIFPTVTSLNIVQNTPQLTLINFATADEKDGLTFIIPQNTPVGNYTLGGFNWFPSIMYYKLNNTASFSTIDGNLNITGVDYIVKTISGTFSLYSKEKNSSSNIITITGGTFASSF